MMLLKSFLTSFLYDCFKLIYEYLNEGDKVGECYCSLRMMMQAHLHVGFCTKRFYSYKKLLQSNTIFVGIPSLFIIFPWYFIYKSSRPEFSVKKLFLEISQNSQENTCARVSGLVPATLLKMRLLMRLFSCEFCEISKNTFLHKTPLMAASVYSSLYGRLYVNHAQNQHFWSFLIIYKGHCSSEILWQNLVSKQLWLNYWKRKFEKLCTIRRE